jgi:hypothetical protein
MASFKNRSSTKQQQQSDAPKVKAYLSAWFGGEDDKHLLGGYIKLTPQILEAIVERVNAGNVGEYGLELSFRIYENEDGSKIDASGNAILRD